MGNLPLDMSLPSHEIPMKLVNSNIICATFGGYFTIRVGYCPWKISIDVWKMLVFNGISVYLRVKSELKVLFKWI